MRVNKPIAFVCACVASLGLVVLSRCTYLTVVFGEGDPEAGNWFRYEYLTERDAATGKVRRDWVQKHWVGSTEAPVWSHFLDTWFVGFGLLVIGAGIYIVEQSSRSNTHF